MSKHPLEAEMRAKLDRLPLDVPTKYLTREVFASARVFGKGRLTAKNDVINSLHYPALLYLYSKESWLVD